MLMRQLVELRASRPSSPRRQRGRAASSSSDNPDPIGAHQTVAEGAAGAHTTGGDAAAGSSGDHFVERVHLDAGGPRAERDAARDQHQEFADSF
jgi:hypothetical protein